MTYEEQTAYIEEIPRFSSKNPPAHTRLCLERLGNPDRDYPSVHIAGTNGKGSVCAYLASVFRTGGLKTALFTSPHLVSMRERFRIDGGMISEEEFSGVFEKVRLCIQKMQEEGLPHPSYFEFLYLMAAVYFSEMKADIAVIETGLGGRLDATNTLEHPLLAVITSVSLDHMQYLGDTSEAIAREKAGIIKAGVPCIYDAANEEAARVIRAAAERKGAPAFPMRSGDYKISGNGAGKIDFSTSFRYYGNTSFRISSPAPYQAENAALSLLAISVLKNSGNSIFRDLTTEKIKKAISETVWEGRMEEIQPGVYLDGAHNEDGIRRFIEAAEKIAGGKPAGLLFGAVNDKDYAGMIHELARGLPVAYAVTTEIAGKRRETAERFAGLFRENGIEDVQAVGNPAEAYRNACARKGNGCLFICGSLYLAGRIKELINDKL